MAPRDRREDRRDDDGTDPLSEARDLFSDERAVDALMMLVGRYVEARLDPADPRNEQYFDWLARMGNASQTPEDRAETEREAERFANRMLARLALERSTVRRVAGLPVQKRQRVSVPMGESVEIAARQRMAAVVEPAVAAGFGRDIWEEPCESFVRVPDKVPRGRYLAMPVAGDSMTPLLHGGDTLLVRLGAEFSTGDVIVARHGDGGYVVKSVGHIKAGVVDLISLNAQYAPMEIPRHELSVLGTVVLRWCAHEVHAGA